MKRELLAGAIYLFSIMPVYAQFTYTNGDTRIASHASSFTSAVKVNLDSLMLDSAITAYQSLYGIPGIATMIVKDKQVIWNRNYGYRNREQMLPVEDSTIFEIASISKTFVGTSIMQLVQRGLIDLDANIDAYLPAGFRVSNPNFPNDSITVKMLLTHTSSIADNWSIMNPLISCGDSPIRLDSFLVGYLTPGGKYNSVNNFYNYRPGTNWNYTDVGFGLAALAVEHVAGKSFYEYCRDSIFLPLSMNSSTWFLAETKQDNLATAYEGPAEHCQVGWPIYPQGSMRTNKLDMVKYLLAYVNYGKSGDVRILDSLTVSDMISDQVGYTSDYLLPWWRLRQGLTWYRVLPINDTGWGSVGSDPGMLSYVIFDPHEKWFTIWFQNYRPDGSELGNIAEINNVFTAYAHLYGNVYAVRPAVCNPYARVGIDSALFRSRFSNVYNHQFTARLIYCNADSTVLDSVLLFDDGMHGDLSASDGVFGAYIPPQQDQDFYSLSVSTVDNQTGKYFSTPDIARFTTVGPVTADSVMFSKGYLDSYHLKVLLHNHSKTTTISHPSLRITDEEPFVTFVNPGTVAFPDIPPDSTVANSSTITIGYIDSLFSRNFDLRFEIMSEGWMYWTDQKVLSGVEEQVSLPMTYKLEQNYPNPFNPTTEIRYQISEVSNVSLKVYDVLGREVRTLVNRKQGPGTYEVRFDASGLASGVYFCGLRTKNYKAIRKMVVVK